MSMVMSKNYSIQRMYDNVILKRDCVLTASCCSLFLEDTRILLSYSGT